jgi:phosphoribosyl 1,2-cyclic phosphodiesterase
VVGEETVHLVLAHLSETNNDPVLARATVETALVDAGRTRVSLSTARQDRPAAAVRL